MIDTLEKNIEGINWVRIRIQILGFFLLLIFLVTFMTVSIFLFIWSLTLLNERNPDILSTSESLIRILLTFPIDDKSFIVLFYFTLIILFVPIVRIVLFFIPKILSSTLVKPVYISIYESLLDKSTKVAKEWDIGKLKNIFIPMYLRVKIKWLFQTSQSINNYICTISSLHIKTQGFLYGRKKRYHRSIDALIFKCEYEPVIYFEKTILIKGDVLDKNYHSYFTFAILTIFGLFFSGMIGVKINFYILSVTSNEVGMLIAFLFVMPLCWYAGSVIKTEYLNKHVRVTESEEFEKYFDVETEIQQISEYINHDFAQSLVLLKKNYDLQKVLFFQNGIFFLFKNTNRKKFTQNRVFFLKSDFKRALNEYSKNLSTVLSIHQAIKEAVSLMPNIRSFKNVPN